MKTPRELLWQRHQAIVPKLDAVRARALAQLPSPPPAPNPAQPAHGVDLRTRLQSWLAPLRWHLAGLGAAWALVLLFNLGDSNSIPSAQFAAQRTSTSARQLLAALQENRRQMTEWLGPSLPASASAPASAPRDPVAPPKRRSELSTPWMNA